MTFVGNRTIPISFSNASHLVHINKSSGFAIEDIDCES